MADHAPPVDTARLVAEHHAALYAYAYRLSGSAADAEDLTQQVFLVAQTKLDQLRCAQSARAWLCAVLRNAWLKSRMKRQPTPAGNLELNIDSIPEDTPDESALDQEALQAALNRLPDEFKTVLLQFYFEHRSYREIAEDQGLPIGTVMSRLSRAKSHLRAALIVVEDQEHRARPAPARPAKVK
jgi:RNA polymerase sigma-70 factor (ECF subfamily)